VENRIAKEMKQKTFAWSEVRTRQETETSHRCETGKPGRRTTSLEVPRAQSQGKEPIL